MATTVVTTATLSERNIISVFAETEESNDVDVEEAAKPKQVNVHMGEDPSTMANFTYTTVAGGLETKVVLNKEGESEEIVFYGENSIGNAYGIGRKLMQWIRIVALLLELLSIGLSNEQVVETVSERFGLSKEEIEKWL